MKGTEDLQTDHKVKAGYKQTEVGVIPEDWAIMQLGDLGKFSKGAGIRKDEALSGDLPCIRYGEIYTKHSNYIKEFYSFISTAIAENARKLLKGDVLFAGSGETKEEIGKCVTFNDDFEAYAGGDIVIYTTKIAEPLYLGYLLNSPSIQKQKASRGQGDAVVHISAKQLAEIQIPLPPTKAEQTAIATALSDMDNLIAGLEKLIEKKKAIKQGAMQELLSSTGSDGKLKEGWMVKKLGEVGEIDPENLNSSTTSDYSFHYISLEDVDNGILNSTTELTFRNAPSRARRIVRQNDILISTVRPNLKSHLLVNWETRDLICSTGFSVFRCNKKMADSTYIYYHLFAGWINAQIDALITGSNYPSINSTDIRNLEVPLPTIQEQKRISSILFAMESEINSKLQVLFKYRKVKQGMMQELLTGKTRFV